MKKEEVGTGSQGSPEPKTALEEALREMDKGVRCLAIELPESIHQDIARRWFDVKVAMLLALAPPAVPTAPEPKVEGYNHGGV